MRYNSSATDLRRIALSAAAYLKHLWDEGVYVNELLLSGPWQQEGEMRWRRTGRGAWTLDGSTPPLTPIDEPEPGVSPRRAPSSC